MSKEVFDEIKSVIATISILKYREKTFREELDFFNQKGNLQKDPCAMLYSGGLKRLEHEVGFLCVDTYSLHEGIEKKRSLYARVIKNNGKTLSKVDKPNINDVKENYDISMVNRPCTEEEKNTLIEMSEKENYEQRKQSRDLDGITSSEHSKLDEWVNQILDKEVLSELENYRNEFAHRLDSLDNLKRELLDGNPKCIHKMLDVVLKVLTEYEQSLQNILGYTKSLHCFGITNFHYDSLSRLKEYELGQSISKFNSTIVDT
ncbi:MAG: hypothetical protein RLZZ381_3052 [Cyanobacteriota bacterium]|jgi:hypothetical protein